MRVRAAWRQPPAGRAAAHARLPRRCHGGAAAAPTCPSPPPRCLPARRAAGPSRRAAPGSPPAWRRRCAASGSCRHWRWRRCAAGRAAPRVRRAAPRHRHRPPARARPAPPARAPHRLRKPPAARRACAAAHRARRSAPSARCAPDQRRVFVSCTTARARRGAERFQQRGGVAAGDTVAVHVDGPRRKRHRSVGGRQHRVALNSTRRTRPSARGAGSCPSRCAAARCESATAPARATSAAAGAPSPAVRPRQPRRPAP